MKNIQVSIRIFTVLLVAFFACHTTNANNTYRWTGAALDGGNWDNPCNWDNNDDPSDCDGVPGAQDNVIISGHHFVHLNSHTQVLSLYMDGYSSIEGNYTFIVQTNATIKTGINIDQRVIIGGELETWGNLYGADSLFVYGSMKIHGGAISEKKVIAYSTIYWEDYSFKIFGGGELVIAQGCTMHFRANSGTGINPGTLGGTLVNYGTIVAQYNHTYTVSCKFKNYGNVNTDAGMVFFTNIANEWNAGTVSVANNARLKLSGVNSFTGTNLVSNGVIELHGTVSFNAACSMSCDTFLLAAGNITVNFPAVIPHYVQTGGIYTGNQTLTVTHSMRWDGGHIYGSGDVDVYCVPEFGGSGTRYTSSRYFTFHQGAVWNSGGFALGLNCVFFIPEAYNLIINADENVLMSRTGGGGQILDVSGNIVKYGAGNANLDVIVNSPDSVRIHAGSLQVRMGTHTNTVFAVQENTLLNFTNNNILDNCRIEGTGTTEFTSSTSTLLNGTTLNTRLALVNAGLEVNTPISPLGFDHLGGNIQGTASVHVLGNLNWNCNGCGYYGSGEVRIDGFADINNINKTISGRTMHLKGNANWSNGNIALQSGGKLLVAPGATLTISHSGNHSVSGTAGSGTFQVDGILEKTTNVLTDVKTAFVNNGTLRGIGTIKALTTAVQAGTIAPGNALSTLNWTNSLSNQAGSNFIFDMNENNGVLLRDEFKITGNIALAGTLTLNTSGAIPAGTYTLITATGTVSGTFSGANLPTGYVLGYTANTVYVTVPASFTDADDRSAEPATMVSITVYPNPMTDYFQVTTSPNFNGTLEVFDASGKRVLHSKQLQDVFDTAAWAPGVYVLRIVAEDFNRELKLLKQ